MSSPVHYYVWYRIAGDPSAAQAAVDALLHDVFRRAGVSGRRLVRRDDPRTWMEVYEHVGDDALFEHELAAAVERHGIARLVEGGRRHTEPFVLP
jgi:hypothetical protein